MADRPHPIRRAARRVPGARLVARRLGLLPAHHPDEVVVALPSGVGTGRPLRLWHLEGRDQVARALRVGGWDGFEPPLPTLVARTMARTGGTLLDVGANTGLYSVIAALAHPGARAIAFEPVPAIADLLRANVALNGLQARIDVDGAAIGDRTGPTTLHLPPPQADGTVETSASLEPDFKEEIDHTLAVHGSTLDDAWHHHGEPRVALVKVDVEGAEARVLAGASRLLATHRPLVSVEVLGRLDEAPLEAARRQLGFFDVALGPGFARVQEGPVTAVPEAPNHLLVPPEALPAVLADLREVPGLQVSEP